MAKQSKKESDAPESTIHAAELASGPSGAVECGEALDETAAIDRRKRGLDIVVCGDDGGSKSRAFGSAHDQTPDHYWMYDEFDRVPFELDKLFRHSILLTNGVELEFEFRFYGR